MQRFFIDPLWEHYRRIVKVHVRLHMFKKRKYIIWSNVRVQVPALTPFPL